MNSHNYKQPWISKPFVELWFIIMPPFLCLLIIAVFPLLFQNNSYMPEAGWVIMILLVDVAHVYSTLYRTYFDATALKKQRSLLTIIPFAAFVIGAVLYSISSLWFWRILAYVAVYHFIRQQYGFMRIYSRKEQYGKAFKLIDKLTIYYATLYPIAYWHLKPNRNFNWFVQGDFFSFQSAWLLNMLTVFYLCVVAVFFIKEMVSFLRHKYINFPKLAVISGTLVSWYFGIVYFNGDMAFTLLNVVSHGIPYMALIWLYGNKQTNKPATGKTFLKTVFSSYGIIIFLSIVFLFAFIEESLWDAMVWNEHGKIFRLPDMHLSPAFLSIIVPLLAVPQITHYVIDGFIWRIKNEDIKWSNEIAATKNAAG